MIPLKASCFINMSCFQFATRAVRVVDLITNLDMPAFQTQGGLTSFINRLEVSSAALAVDIFASTVTVHVVGCKYQVLKEVT